MRAGVPDPIPHSLRKAIAVYEAGKALLAYITPDFEEVARVREALGGNWAGRRGGGGAVGAPRGKEIGRWPARQAGLSCGSRSVLGDVRVRVRSRDHNADGWLTRLHVAAAAGAGVCR